MPGVADLPRERNDHRRDHIRVSVHSLLFANPTIDGLASIIRPARPNVQWQLEGGDNQPGACILRYEIGFRTLTADLTA